MRSFHDMEKTIIVDGIEYVLKIPVEVFTYSDKGMLVAIGKSTFVRKTPCNERGALDGEMVISETELLQGRSSAAEKDVG